MSDKRSTFYIKYVKKVQAKNTWPRFLQIVLLEYGSVTRN